MELRLALLGCGNVGHALLEMVTEKEHDLLRRFDLRLSFTGGLTRSAGGWVAPEGLTARQVLSSGWPLGELPTGSVPFAGDGVAFAAACPADALVELTSLRPQTGEPAISHVRAALASGRHVVTANKGPIAHAYRDLRELAAEHGVSLRFESTVLDGTPIFNLADFTLPVTRILGFRGPLNSTSNFVLSQMMAGASVEDGVTAAQRAGVAEADPSYDLDGWDASVKAVVLANVLMDADLRPADVKRLKLGAQAMRTAVAALKPRATLKQMVEATRGADGHVEASVRLVPLPPGDAFAHLAGMETGLRLRTDTMGELTLIEGEGGPGQTAFGVLTDLITIVRGLAPSVRRGPPSGGLGR
jgi:homoserine dehydrogenase